MITKIPSEDGGYHSVETSLLNPGGWALDAGCRGFSFTRAMRDLGCTVLALDPASDVVCPEELKFGPLAVRFANLLLTERCSMYLFYESNDRMSSTIIPSNRHAMAEIMCVGLNVATLMSLIGIAIFDVVKLDIEGAEYSVLNAWPGPVARQISVEWHRTPNCLWPVYCDGLAKWYTCVKNDELDSLFVLK